jgi:hypothetical protein
MSAPEMTAGYALTLVGILASDNVARQRLVGVVDDQAMARQCRPTVLAQRRQALVTARQVVTVNDA